MPCIVVCTTIVGEMGMYVTIQKYGPCSCAVFRVCVCVCVCVCMCVFTQVIVPASMHTSSDYEL